MPARASASRSKLPSVLVVGHDTRKRQRVRGIGEALGESR